MALDHKVEGIEIDVDVGNGEAIPTLSEVFDFLKPHHEVFVNLELKAPTGPPLLNKYPYHAAAT